MPELKMHIDALTGRIVAYLRTNGVFGAWWEDMTTEERAAHRREISAILCMEVSTEWSSVSCEIASSRIIHYLEQWDSFRSWWRDKGTKQRAKIITRMVEIIREGIAEEVDHEQTEKE